MVLKLKRLSIPLAACAVLAVAALAVTSIRAAGTAPTPVGAPATGETSFEFIGKLDQPSLDVSNFYGYVTHVAGIADSKLFTQGDRSDSTARLTFFVTAKLDAHLHQLPLFVTTGAGTISFYLNAAGGASIADPASFRRGAVVATAAARFQDVLNAQSETSGLESASGTLRQLTAATFTLAGKTYRFGHRGLRSHIAMSGAGMRTVIPLTRTVVSAGVTTVTG
jgi:hypothetical protein